MKAEYQVKDVYGKVITGENMQHHIFFDKKTGYFVLKITTTGPRFSFSLCHNKTSMVIYLPFKHDRIYYALDFKVRQGNYLFDFSTKGRKKVYINSNIPYFIIAKVNWKKQSEKFLKSSYANDTIYSSINQN